MLTSAWWGFTQGSTTLLPHKTLEAGVGGISAWKYQESPGTQRFNDRNNSDLCLQKFGGKKRPLLCRLGKAGADSNNWATDDGLWKLLASITAGLHRAMLISEVIGFRAGDWVLNRIEPHRLSQFSEDTEAPLFLSFSHLHCIFSKCAPYPTPFLSLLSSLPPSLSSRFTYCAVCSLLDIIT